MLARELGVADAYLEVIEDGALVHDLAVVQQPALARAADALAARQLVA